MPKSKFSFPSISNITFDDWDFNYLGKPLIQSSYSTRITVTDTQIEIDCDWSSMNTLYALKTVESRSGQRAFWTGEHYTFPIAALPVVEDIFKGRSSVEWIELEAAKETLGTVAVFLEYCGNCRSRQSKQQQRMLCKQCSGKGLWSQYTGSLSTRNCPTCGGNGAVAGFPNVEPYASGWWNGGWNLQFPEKVLRAYFGEPETKFNGNFFEALLGASNISKQYKQLARQYHPDVYKKGSQMFLKLQEAYETLRDPQRRKRYEAGLKFQQLTVQVKSDVVFELPRKCGDLLVKGEYEKEVGETIFWLNNPRQRFDKEGSRGVFIVSEIINWNDRIDPQGRIMTSTWNPRETGSFGRAQRRREQAGEKPFTITWEQPPVEFVINI